MVNARLRGLWPCAQILCRMFKSKRTVLIRRLWRSRGGSATGDQGPDSQGFDRDLETDSEFKSAAHSLLKRLKDRQLELLLDAIESRGTTSTACVPLPKGDVRLGRGRTAPPQVLCCQLYRWPDIKQVSELKRLTFCCQTGRDGEEISSGNVCCNPYHLSRLCRPGKGKIAIIFIHQGGLVIVSRRQIMTLIILRR